MLDREKLERALAELPLFQFAYVDTKDLVFTRRVRTICERECPMYNTTWACPPAVGTVEECRARCLAYPEALVITTVTEVSDIANLGETLATRAPHEKIAHQVAALLRGQGQQVMVLSTEACAICDRCAWPNSPCRHPEQMFPCIESHGILATDLAEKCGLDFFNGNIVTWFSLLFFKDQE